MCASLFSLVSCFHHEISLALPPSKSLIHNFDVTSIDDLMDITHCSGLYITVLKLLSVNIIVMATSRFLTGTKICISHAVVPSIKVRLLYQ